ncbi:hypothetical protein JY651_22280 [Pyxidicoccus parkwayensis]|uniref:Uncharacterized protein n=1 Tax=Pyxidicoccus parkwayensis TaxID=2813578 RepID=A0ABX7PAJ1_9BACT|nr:hypothetical protein [Pyxidicoccus parkwaysis]QSQ27470.1 hypothetical protein JY651_22280 [Pyxidicoccus parkwaysis]
MRSIAGWFLLIIGLTGFAVEIDNLRNGKTDSTVLGFFLSTAFIISGLALFRSARRARMPVALQEEPVVARLPARSPRDIERAVLTCAQKHGGRVTIAEVAAGSELSFTEAKTVLEELSHAGACTVDVTEHGAFIYEFNGLMPRDPKREATET